MKQMKKMMALVIAMVMMLAMAVPAMAASNKITPAGTEPGKITITNSSTSVSLDGRTFRAYKILDATATVDEEDTQTPKEYKNVAYTVPDYMVPFFTNNTLSGLNLTLTGIPTDAPSAALNKAVTEKLGAMTDDSAALIAFAEKARDWAKNNVDYYEATGAAENATSVVFEHLPLGYYLVDDQTTNATAGNAVSSVILDTTTPRQTIVVKASTTTSDKSITGFNTGETGETNVTTRQLYKTDTEGNVDVADVSVGDVIHFQVDSVVPDTRGYNYYKFVINDTMDKGLKLIPSTIKITISGGEEETAYSHEYTVASEDLEVTTDPATVTGEGTTTLKIVLKNALAKFTAAGVSVGDAIAITYDAELLDKAPVGQAVENHVTIDYTNNPSVDVDNSTDDFTDEDPKGTTPEEVTKTYTTELTIIKVDETGAPLTGAEFTLTGTSANKTVVKTQKFEEATTFATGEAKYWKLADGSYTTQDPTTPTAEGTNVPKYDLSKYADYTDGDGLGQAASYKTYKLTTTTTVTDEENTDKKVVATTDANGVVTFSGLSEGTYTITETGVPSGYNGIDPITTQVTFTYANNEGTFTATNFTAEGDNTFITTIVNHSGQELPSTGGMGTTIFYIVGAALVLGAGIMLVTRRRMSAN